MCGIFGYLGPQPDFQTLFTVAELAATRGMHSFGVSVAVGGNPAVHWRWPGTPAKARDGLRDAYRELSMLKGEWTLVGHCRLATFGAYTDSRNFQPIEREGWAVAHNGNVYNHARLFAEYGVEPQTDNDSEALAMLASVHGPHTPQEFRDMLGLAERRSIAVLLMAENLGIFAFADGLPLFEARDGRGLWLCSRRPDFGGPSPLSLDREHATLYTYDNGNIQAVRPDARASG